MKKKFYFSQDAKITTWVTQQFYIEAETEEEAMKLAEEYKTVDIATSDMSHCIIDTQYNSESHELMGVEENDYRPTIELYDNKKWLLGNNMDSIVPDDDFLFDKFISMMKSSYIPRDEKFAENLHQTALRMFNDNVKKLEEQYPALKTVILEDNGRWCDVLVDAVVDTYKLKLRLVTPFEDALHHLNRYIILDRAKKNNEKPLGYVLDYLKENYSLPKTEGLPVAEKILNFFKIEEE